MESKQEPWLGIRERVQFAQQYLRDPRGQPWAVRDYQRESLESRAQRKVHCDGRDVGKTLD